MICLLVSDPYFPSYSSCHPRVFGVLFRRAHCRYGYRGKCFLFPPLFAIPGTRRHTRKTLVSAAGPSATTALNVASVCFGLRDSNFRDHYFRIWVFISETLPLALFLHPRLKQMNSGFDFDHALGMTYQNVSFLFVCKTVLTLLIFFFGMGLRPWILILSRMGLYPRWDRLMSLLVRGADLASRGHTGWSLATSP